MRRYLIVDGNYFAQRVLGATKFTLTNDKEKLQFEKELYVSLINLWQVFRNRGLIDQILFCTDFGSWRKQVEPFKPYWMEEKIPIGYKEQRVEKKEKSPIDYDAFYSIYQKFVDDIKRLGCVVFKTAGLEGDDNISLLSNYFRQNDNMRGIIFATDGDLEQCVNDNVILFKNVRSKEAPNGEIVMSLRTYTNSYETNESVESVLLGNQSEIDWIRNVCKVVIGDLNGLSKIERQINKGLKISKPFKTLFVKSFAGDKKDNLFSPISWKSQTGSVRYGITEKIISATFDRIMKSFTEQSCLEIMNSPFEFNNFIHHMINCSKDPSAPFETVKQHILHNLRMNSLSPLVYATEIPRELKENFVHQLIEQKSLMETGDFPMQQLEDVVQSFECKINQSIFESCIVL